MDVYEGYFRLRNEVYEQLVLYHATNAISTTIDVWC